MCWGGGGGRTSGLYPWVRLWDSGKHPELKLTCVVQKIAPTQRPLGLEGNMRTGSAGKQYAEFRVAWTASHALAQ